ncbi:SEL1-like repeat protein, partial [Bacteroides xylanisolvens]
MKTNLSKEMDSEMLFDLIRKANRDKDAAFELGAMYLNGNKVCQDTQRAIFYFQQASR